MLVGQKLRGFQMGLESTQGTIVPANRLIPNGTFKMSRKNNIMKATDEGHRAPIGVQKGKRNSEWSIDGQLGYNVLAYIGAGLFDAANGAAPTTLATGAYSYSQADVNPATLHVPQTFSFEHGNSGGSNSKFGFGTMTDLTVTVNETACSYAVSGFGSYPQKNISLTAAPTRIAPVLANYGDFRLSYATTFSNLSTGKLLTAKDITMSIKGKYKSQFFIDDATTSIGGILETVPDTSGSITVAEGSESDYFLGNLEGGTPFYLQLKGTGPLLATGTPNIYNQFIYTWNCFVETEEETDSDDLFAGKYNFYSGEDLVNNDITFYVVNGLSAL